MATELALSGRFLLVALRFWPLPCFSGMICRRARCFAICRGFFADQNCGPRGGGRFSPDAHGMFAFAPGFNAAEERPDALESFLAQQ